ncbi:MAG: thiamine phosphate synthase [Acidobacteria bacterium]|nr:thiamine phosphate synthase [Acidobacteriota bacterium]
MRKRFDLSLYVITDRRLSLGRSSEEIVERAIAGGATVIQLREKELSDRQLYEEGLRIKEIIGTRDVLFVVNDRVDLALALDADGVHLGQDDLPLAVARRLLGENRIIGVSVQTPEEAQEAEREGADYLAASGVFPTTTKPDVGAVLGIPGLKRIREATSLPLVAIGGINLANVKEVIGAGADGIAVVSAVTTASDVTARCRELLSLVKRAKEERVES